MSRFAPTAHRFTNIQGFVLGRLRDQGPMNSADFAEARRGEFDNGAREWAIGALRKLQEQGFAQSQKQGRSLVFSITDAGLAAIADLPNTPTHLCAMPDSEGQSVCRAMSMHKLRDTDPAEITFERIVNATPLREPLDAAEIAEIVRIGHEITGRDLTPQDDVRPEV